MKKWIQEEVDLAISLLQEKKTYGEIGEILNRSSNSVRVKLNKFGFAYKQENPKEIKQCLNCGNELTGYSEKFCSRSCSATFNNKLRASEKKTKQCLNCKKDIPLKNLYYCNNKCQGEYEAKQIVEKWKNGLINGGGKSKEDLSDPIRRYIFDKHNHECSECNWNEVNKFTGLIPLQIHHIDNDPRNNKEENLVLLCPNCHSLTDNFGSRNKGKGRKIRR